MNIHTIKKLLLVIMAIVVVASCKKEDKPKLLTLSAENISVEFEKTGTLNITDGNGGYTVKIADESVAKATITENIITVTGIKNGTTTLMITDQRRQTKNITITVKPDPYGNEKADPTRRFQQKVGEIASIIKNQESNYYFYSDKGSMELGANTKTKSKLGWSSPETWSYFFVMWDGDFTVGNKTNAILTSLTNNGTPQTVALKKLSVIQVKDNLTWVAYEMDDKTGIIVQ